MSHWNPKANEIFLGVLECDSEEERLAHLEQACQGDVALRAEVESLLNADRDAPSMLDQMGNCPTIDQTVLERVGDTIGDYSLREQIGEGGMGVVYVAEQMAPIRRKVAFKVIKSGLASKEITNRFEAERQALAMMDHPNIAKVFDGGVSEQGRPFIVMELVQGLPIHEFCDQHRMSTNERLNRFLDVCRAVQHAHHKGIIHRDLKPSNVLVAEIDEMVVPKVIDFGVAKAVGQEFIDQTFYTSFTQMIGTPLYMSPEQTRMGVVDVDTRSDVYSLGVMLYELLTGTTPFASEELKQAGFDEMRRIIQEEEPSRPSRQISTLSANVRSTVSERRSTDHRQLGNTLQGELDWIVMKALAKDRDRRYQSAGEFAEDIERYLRNEPVEAHPPSLGYRLGKFVHRNAGLVTAVAVVLLCLVGGIAGTTWGMLQARQERDAARIAQNNEEKQRLNAEANAQRARRAIDSEKAVIEFVEQRIIAGARPSSHDGGLGYDATIRQAVEAALPFLESSFEEQPLVRARLHETIGISFDSLGEYELAMNQFQESHSIVSERLGAENPITLRITRGLAVAYSRLGRHEEARELQEKVLATSNDVLGGKHPDTIHCMGDLAITYDRLERHAEAAELLEEALKLFRDVPDVDQHAVSVCLGNLAKIYRGLGRFDDATKLNEEAFELFDKTNGGEHPSTLRAMHSLAHEYESANRHADAHKLLKTSYDLMKQELGPYHPDTLKSGTCLAKSHERSGDYESAIAVQEEGLKWRETKFGPRHTETLQNMDDLVINYIRLRTYDLAHELCDRVVELRKSSRGVDDPATLESMSNLVACYQGLQRVEDAAKLGKEVLDGQTAVLGVADPDTLWSMSSLAATYRALGRTEEALELSKRAFELRKAKLGVDHKETLKAMRDLALSYHALKDYDESIRLYEDVLELNEKKNPGQYDRKTLRAMGRLAILYRKANKLGPAIELLEKTLVFQKEVLGENDADTVKTVEFLAMECRGEPQRVDDAKRYSEELIVLMERARTPNRLAFMSDYALWLAISSNADAVDRSRAEELAQEVVNSDSGNGRNWYVLGTAQLRMEHYPQAARSLICSGELLQGGDSGHWFLLAIAEAKQDHHTAARTWYDKANEWMKQNLPDDQQLVSFRDEARELLGIDDLESEATKPTKEASEDEPSAESNDNTQETEGTRSND